MFNRELDRVSRQTFRLLDALLRPVAGFRDGVHVSEASGRENVPPQRGDITVEFGSALTYVTVVQTLCLPDEMLRLNTGLALPPAALAYALEVGRGTRLADGMVSMHTTARNDFNLACAHDRSAALLSADARGVYVHEIVAPVSNGALRFGLRYVYPTTTPVGVSQRMQLRIRFDAGGRFPHHLGVHEARTARRPMVRFGTSHGLDSVLGAYHPRWESPIRRVCAGVMSRASKDVFVSCDRAESASAAFRGVLAGRTIRLVVDVRRVPPAATDLGSGEAAAKACTIPLMAADLTSQRMTDLGLEHHVVTRWTSLLAVAEPLQARHREPASVEAVA